VAEDHQARNAEALVSRNAAIMIPDREAIEKLVDTMLDLLGDENRQQQLSNNIKQLGITDAAERIAAEVIKLIETT
jgi:UDP-N-acetylglucosamine--N-acetylmuramyl-(pentapeptide) pyrophosphoryl-undecaprenol N-acetylglucosamine transferase